jgi:hypothetical protein
MHGIPDVALDRQAPIMIYWKLFIEANMCFFIFKSKLVFTENLFRDSITLFINLSLQVYLVHKKRPPPRTPHGGGQFLMSEVPLYCNSCHENQMNKNQNFQSQECLGVPHKRMDHVKPVNIFPIHLHLT